MSERDFTHHIDFTMHQKFVKVHASCNIIRKICQKFYANFTNKNNKRITYLKKGTCFQIFKLAHKHIALIRKVIDRQTRVSSPRIYEQLDKLTYSVQD